MRRFSPQPPAGPLAFCRRLAQIGVFHFGCWMMSFSLPTKIIITVWFPPHCLVAQVQPSESNSCSFDQTQKRKRILELPFIMLAVANPLCFAPFYLSVNSRKLSSSCRDFAHFSNGMNSSVTARMLWMPMFALIDVWMMQPLFWLKPFRSVEPMLQNLGWWSPRRPQEFSMTPKKEIALKSVLSIGSCRYPARRYYNKAPKWCITP